ncbi:MAG: gliding motility-associated C-terminal domain-containing protein [Chitinophagaceae bacterium]|nr:gliding motility-associated C-terminal domain-containing protein [Chitinophagaceae bacterium]
MVFRRHFVLIYSFIFILLQVEGQVVPDFSVPENVCAGEPFTITNNTTGGSTFKWTFCAKNLNRAPATQNLGNIGGALNEPMYMDIVFTNNNYYGFVTNFSSGNLIRLDFGNSLSNAPGVVNLGNVGGALPNGGNTGIQVVESEGRWYAIIVSGDPVGGINPRISKIEFGNNITNAAPTGTNWNGVASMYDPNDLVLVKEGNEWIGFTVNGERNSLTRFVFTSNFTGDPVMTNMGDIGTLGEPAGLSYIEQNGDKILFITNSGDKDRINGQFTITRLNFGATLKNDDPNAVNIGNVSHRLEHPRDMALAPFCNELVGFVLNGHPFYNSILRLDFDGDLNSFPVANDVGTFPGFDYPNAITDFFAEDDKLIAFVVNRQNSSISRIVFSNCNNSSVAGSAARNPAPVSYNLPGVYNIEMLVDEGQGSEIRLCKEVVVTSCSDSVIITNDTTICSGTSLTIQTNPAITYEWTPAEFLDDANSSSPTTTATRSMKYYVDALMEGENLVKNGSFSNGIDDLTSEYSYTPTNVVEGEYFVGNDPHTWNISLGYCGDHTSGSGRMMFVNGSPNAGLVVWSQTVEVKPNTDYSFSAWLQAIYPTNPASIVLRANGTPLGAAEAAVLPNCTWTKASRIWNSGGNTIVTLSIVNTNTSINGNDFALDDISLNELVTARDSIAINVRQPFIKTNEDTTVCRGHPVYLEVAPGSFFAWSPAAGLSNHLSPNPIATPSVTTQYVVTGIDPGGCPASDTVNINVVPSPVVTITDDTAVCSAGVVQLQATGGDTYSWSPSAAMNNSSVANPVTKTLTNDVTYRVTVTGGNGCTTEDSVKITVRPYPKFAASGPAAVCAGSPVTLQASGGDVYRWSPASVLPDPNSSNNTFTPSTNGLYSVNIRENACNRDTTITLAVNVNPVPELSVTKSNDINCSVPSAVLEASGAKNYLWSPEESVSDPKLPRVVSSADTTTLYTVAGTNDFGCTSSATVTVNVDNSGVPRFVVPNAFSPNNDGKNDCFGIQRWGRATIKQFSIYNRWGRLVFQTSDVSACWDGKMHGIPQEPGAYVYIIRAETICGEVTRKGLVTLIR